MISEHYMDLQFCLCFSFISKYILLSRKLSEKKPHHISSNWLYKILHFFFQNFK